MGVLIVVRQGESVAAAMKRLKRTADKGGITRASRRQESFVKQSEVRREQKFRRRFKARKATLLRKLGGANSFQAHQLLREFWNRGGKA
jgi:ribosomal protein S21